MQKRTFLSISEHRLPISGDGADIPREVLVLRRETEEADGHGRVDGLYKLRDPYNDREQ